MVSDQSTAAVSGQGIAAKAAEVANEAAGSNYLWGGKTIKGFDCSGFVSHVFGKIFPNASAAYQMSVAGYIASDLFDAVAEADKKPGDIVIFPAHGGSPNHIGIVLDGATWIGSQSSTGVKDVKFSNSLGRTAAQVSSRAWLVDSRDQWRPRHASRRRTIRMTHSKAGIALMLAAATLASASCAQAPVASPFSKPDWTVAKVSCPAGCADQTLHFLQAQIGHKVQLSGSALEAPFLDQCDGKVRWQLHDGSPELVLAAVNKGAASARRPVRPADLALTPGAMVTGGAALCAGRYGELVMARVLVVTSQRVIILFEQQSLIELR